MASRTRRGGAGPYKSRYREPQGIEQLRTAVLGPSGVRAPGYEVRAAVNPEKRYRCPWCEGWIEPSVRHLVAVPVGRPDDRRHYHTGCWTRRAGAGRGSRR